MSKDEDRGTRIAGVKTDPVQFGGGRPAHRPPYTEAGIARLMCSRAGCGRQAYATWGACADDNVQRPLCPECDVRLNVMALEFMGDPDIVSKIGRYVQTMEDKIGRRIAASWQDG
jgi:hypothetical protein